MKLLNFFKRKEHKKYLKFDKYWRQTVNFTRSQNRLHFFLKYCEGKNILHFGCTDWPIFDANNNLHIRLSRNVKSIHGFDIDKEGIENLKKHVPQNYYSDFTELNNNEYDVCLVPETIEHVGDVQKFLKNLGEVNANIFIITAPNCFSKEVMSRNNYGENSFIELVHPDHNYWYSPFTLKNVIEKYSGLKVEQVILLEDDRMVCCIATRNA